MQGREKRNIDLVAHGGDENVGDVSESAKKALFNEGFYQMEKKYLSFTSNSLIEIDHRDSQKRNTKKKTLYNRGVCFRSLDAFFSRSVLNLWAVADNWNETG